MFKRRVDVVSSGTLTIISDLVFSWSSGDMPIIDARKFKYVAKL